MKTSQLTILFFVFGIILASCSDDEPLRPNQIDEGVVINNVRWATRNVDAPGTFADNPENAGWHYQWNRKRGWSATSEYANWNNSFPEGTEWESVNDPCPPNWRLPTESEIYLLHRAGSVWTTKNEITGRLFGTEPNQIFLPAAGARHNALGMLLDSGFMGLYWSSTASEEPRAVSLHFDNRHYVMATGIRSNAFTIRCVAEN